MSDIVWCTATLCTLDRLLFLEVFETKSHESRERDKMAVLAFLAHSAQTLSLLEALALREKKTTRIEKDSKY